jgi:hypothetical protein
VKQFVAENEARLPALVRREVRHKLETGRKNPKLAQHKVSKASG